jgi:hypothetical protein
MRNTIVVVATVTLVVAGASRVPAQPQPAAPGGGPPAGGMGGRMEGHHPGGPMGGMMEGPHMGGMRGMRGMRGRDHLEHLMVHDAKAAARIMRFRADMLRAMSEVLERHAAELDKGP